MASNKDTEAAGILTHRSGRRDQSGGYGEASRRLPTMLASAAYQPLWCARGTRDPLLRPDRSPYGCDP